MLYGEILNLADVLYPNEYSKEEKLSWIKEVNADVIKNIEKREAPSEPVTEEDASLISAPYEDMYKFYIMAQIAYYQRDWAAYDAHMAHYAARRDDYMAYYIRTYGGKTARFRGWIY